MRFPITEQPTLKRFVVFSFVLHLLIMTVQGLIPVDSGETPAPPPIKVSYVPPPPGPAKKPSTLIDAPEPEKIETPRSSELLSSFNSRAHAKRTLPDSATYRNRETTVPKLSDQASVPSKVKRYPKKKPVTQPDRKLVRRRFSPSDRGFITPPPEPLEESPKDQPVTGNTLALLDGFDPKKYATMDTGDVKEQGDDDLVSLDTQESKYASYFARIKHQIEQVWGYPEEAARKGISGKLSLRFRLSRDGSLMEVRLLTPSGSHVLDEAALTAVKGAAPYYPFPVTIERDTLSILATFVYNPAYQAQHQVRSLRDY